MESKIIAIKNPENVCFKCLKKDVNIHNIKINEMGYGGGFDSWSTEIHLCNDCYNLTNSEWWKFETMPLEEEGIWSDYFKYKYEDEIFEFVENMPIEGKELFWNRYATGDTYCMDSQDWIDNVKNMENILLKKDWHIKIDSLFVNMWKTLYNAHNVGDTLISWKSSRQLKTDRSQLNVRIAILKLIRRLTDDYKNQTRN